MKNGARVLNEAINTTTKKLVLRLKLSTQTAPAGSTTPSPSPSNESYVWSSSSSRDINDPYSISPPLSAPSTTKAKLNKYIEICKDKANKHGFNLQTEIHQVLASKGIILLKKGQSCSELVRYIDAESLLNNIQSDAINRNIKVDTRIYLKLATLLRDINDRTDRRALKFELNKLYEIATKEDGMIIEMFVNLVTKLPNFQRLSPVGEMELTVNFLDPILTHIFHCPDSNKHLVWLNRQDDNTTVCRPDATMVALPQKAENVTLGYVEVKPLDAQSDPELAFMDLVRLGTFARSLMLRKSNRKVLVIQCVGYTMVFYLVSEHSDGITQMAEILTIDAPKEITEVGGLLQKIDDLKRLFLLYDHQLEPRYINVRAPEDDLTSTMETINPKRRKRRIPSFSLV
ncbi:hypothetical protein G6F57_011885 [Rhizopus arrhizus]|uniref:Uncharacterized protein n=1 Tax=Rhizopus oryzae TaxID=64495 RepID=A0A9P7BNK3_RHIOR|nr:hypothetical protein G6F23_009099 [Rhizopus arrhizus]KAG1405946.1 hypothetical protein G6F58_009921 [Rhizopus delemar]KAG0755663.1 hypothetical protein G6F24_011683 [Rhizopus arrhizus]KAG0781839.1 hypothetical protein G6F21_011432 [Rhizopus arrhizus]KAG0785828.1 hypothetical protein G6F22_007825 [Rhizopus arrhizus]